MFILVLFFFSGVTALIYEVIWSDYLTLIFGSTIQAQTVVLAVFMGGLALGNKLFGRFADGARRPLMIYGCLETLIGIYAFCFEFLYRLANNIFVPAGTHLLNHDVWLLFLNGVLSVMLLLGPTILMGGTLPVLAAWLQKSATDPGRRAARFYAVNTLGAVCGAWLAGFLLVEWLGLRLTTEVAAVVNLLVGFTAIMLGRGRLGQPSLPVAGTAHPEVHAGAGGATGEPEILQPSAERPPDAGADTPARRPDAGADLSNIFRWSCLLVAVTGAVSMGLEILASRCLALVFGASLQSFSVVLISFILGIGLGSTVISSPRCRNWSKEITTILLLLATSLLIGFFVLHIEKLAYVYLYAQSGLGRTPMGYDYHEIMATLISICVLGLPAAALGSVLPLWMRAVPETSDLLGDHVGRLVTWNTLGAVVGVLITGFGLMPTIGMRASFAALGLLLAAAAIIAALALRRRFAAVVSVGGGILVLAAGLSGDTSWQDVFSVGIFRMPDMDVARHETFSSYMAGWHKMVKLIFYEDGADATVSVQKVKVGSTNHLYILRIDGKPEASASDGRPSGDLAAQVMVAQLPLMLKPDSRDAFCFGMGSGITAASAIGYPTITNLTVAENCAPVLRAAKLFAPWNRGVLTNSRVHIYHEDARTVLKLSPQKYDVIISEPSNPWLIGIGRVFSREFYELALSRLKPGGYMGQWFHMYEMDDKTLDVVLRTFNSVFPYMEVWDVGDKDMVLVGATHPWKSDPETYRRVFELKWPRHDLAELGLKTPQELMARQFASQRTAYAIAGPGPMESDDFPLLEYQAPRAFYMYQHRQGLRDFPNYDERTWQLELAAPVKNQTLAALTLPQLYQVFGGSFPSGNPQLQSYLENCFQGHVGSMVFDKRVMPCVLADTNGQTVVAPASASTNMISLRLYYAERALWTDRKEWPEVIQFIKKTLDGLGRFGPVETDWSPAYYADLAVKASLILKDDADAKSILLRGLQLEPDSNELRYLSRILIHRGILQPSEVPPRPAGN